MNATHFRELLICAVAGLVLGWILAGLPLP